MDKNERRWQIGRHYLACDDSATIENFYPQHKCDLVFTDPPFEMRATDVRSSLIKAGFVFIVAGCGANYQQLCQLAHFDFHYEIICCRNKPQSLLHWQGPSILHWNNAFLTTHGLDRPHCFDKGLVGGYFPSVIGPYNNPIIGNYSKPIGYAIEILQATHAQTVADPFSGTGTTLAACEKLGKICYAVELEIERCELIINRMRAMNLKVEEL